MHSIDILPMVLIAGAVLWGFMKLQERISFLKHEVRWLRNELESLKPREVKSAHDPT